MPTNVTNTAPLTAEQAALLLALLPPPATVTPNRRPLGNTPERVALAWMRRAAEALVASLLALLLLFHLGFTLPEFEGEPSPAGAQATSPATALSPVQQWQVDWADFVAPPVAVQGLGWVNIPVPVLVAVLAAHGSTFANARDVEIISNAAAANNLNPLLLFAAIRAEHRWNLQADHPSDWQLFASNPFDVAVYGDWHATPYTLAQSAEIAARTLATRLSAPPPGNENPLLWIEDPRNPAGQGVYATSPTWWSTVAAIAGELTGEVAQAGATSTMTAASIGALGTFALAVASTPDAVAEALALRATGTGPLAWVGQALSTVHAFVYQHTVAFVSGALVGAAALVGTTIGAGVVSAVADAAATALADVAVAGVAAAGAAA